jgi:cytochrome c
MTPRGPAVRFDVCALIAGTLFMASIGGAALPAQEAGQAVSVNGGVYTAAQAKRGATVYDERCSDCHQQDLSGGDRGSALAGDTFLNAWIDLTVGDLFERIRTSMPVESPGSLTPQATSDIVAFLLQSNDYPAGASELASDPAVLKDLTITRRN